MTVTELLEEEIRNSELMKELPSCYFCGDPIVKMNGRDADSIYIHHISYVPEVKVSSHHSCHASYHSTHVANIPYSSMKKEFIENLDEKVICYFCGDEVIKMRGLGVKSLVIHSLDGNHYNWAPGNKVPCHRGCHGKYHFEGDKNPSRRPEVSRKISATKIKNSSGLESNKKGWPVRREKYGPSGVRDPEARRQKISDALKGDNNPMKDPDVAKRSGERTRGKIGVERSKESVKTRHERYGSSWCKDPDCMRGDNNPAKRPEVRVKISRNNPMNNPESVLKIWVTRRARYGPSGRRLKQKGEA